MKIKKTSFNQEFLQKKDLQPFMDFGIDEITKATQDNIYQILAIVKNDIENYLISYNKAFLQFQRQSGLVRKLRSLPTSSKQNIPDGKNIYIEEKRYLNERKATLEFIQVLEAGQYLLQRFRSLIVGNSIQTQITIRIKNEVYTVDKKDIQDYITPILSTFGGSTKDNPFSLAYQIDIDSIQTKDELFKNLTKISGTDIYKQIFKMKVPYLVQKKGWDENYARKKAVFNSKDAEIYDLMSQMEKQSPGSTKNWLNIERYASLRASMGGGGGYRTNQLKSGDVGLIQDKFITSKQESVNIIRQQMIEEKLKKLLSIVSLPSTKGQEIKNELKNMFTESEKNINSLDIITKQTNKIAQEMIDQLFEKLDK